MGSPAPQIWGLGSSWRARQPAANSIAWEPGEAWAGVLLRSETSSRVQGLASQVVKRYALSNRGFPRIRGGTVKGPFIRNVGVYIGVPLFMETTTTYGFSFCQTDVIGVAGKAAFTAKRVRF